MFSQELQNMGFTKGESKVYEALLILENSTVGPIVKKSGVSYSKIYEVLDKLISKGLVSYSVKENVRYFQITNPNRLTNYVTLQEEEVVKNKEILNKILPPIQDIYQSASKKEGAEIFIGTKGLVAAYESLLDSLQKGEDECFFYVYDQRYYQKSLDFYIKMSTYFKKVNVKSRGIGEFKYKKVGFAKEKGLRYYKHRYVKFPVPGNIDIYRDKVLIINWNIEPISVLINSKEIAENFRNYFNSIWAIAEQ